MKRGKFLSFTIVGMIFFVDVVSAEQAKQNVLSLRCTALPNQKPYVHDIGRLTVRYNTLDAPMLMRVTEKLITYEREDGRGFYAKDAKVKIEDRVIRFGGSKGRRRMSFVVESLGPGPVHYSYDFKSSLMTKVELVSESGSSADNGPIEKEAVNIRQFLCKVESQ